MLDPDPQNAETKPVATKPAKRSRARVDRKPLPSGTKGRGKDWAKGRRFLIGRAAGRARTRRVTGLVIAS
jgi:hypothetical protein